MYSDHIHDHISLMGQLVGDTNEPYSIMNKAITHDNLSFNTHARHNY